ncbi:MAG TPA: helix-turn-helix domain-containing protein, partial [Kofleriaceae bacterium]
DTGYTVVRDVLRAADAIGGKKRFEVTTVGMRRSVRSGLGLQLPVEPIAKRKPDWVIVPALGATTPQTLVPALARPDVCDAKHQLVAWHAAGVKIAASCISTFVIAESGLLDHREATTTWSLAPLFRQRYPEVRLDETRMLVATDIGATAGAALGHLDLALWLVRSVSPELAETVSRYLLADLRSSQAPYIIPNHLAQADPLILRFERWSREHLKAGFSLDAAAKDLATSTRTLQRRCTEVLGKSPLEYFQDLRVEHARSLIQSSNTGIETIAAEVGYADGATLRALLRQRLGRGVRELRADLR